MKHLIFTLLLAFAFPVGQSHAGETRQSIGECLTRKWDGVIRQRQPISSAFDLNRLASSTIGPDFRAMSDDKKKKAPNMIAKAVKRALERHLNYLRKLDYQMGNGRQDFVPKTVTAAVAGHLVHRRSGKKYLVEMTITQKGCMIRNMSVDGEGITDWIRDTPEFKKFMKPPKTS